MMKEVPLETIRKAAHALANKGAPWHFHILTPNCAFNVRHQYAFVFEDSENSSHLVHYSDKLEHNLGQELAPLLHGSKILQKEQIDGKPGPSEDTKRIVERAKELRTQGIEWHHHLLFPGCQYNKNTPLYTLVFEDPEKSTTIENITDEEPTNDLKLIEGLFYAQQ